MHALLFKPVITFALVSAPVLLVHPALRTGTRRVWGENGLLPSQRLSALKIFAALSLLVLIPLVSLTELFTKTSAMPFGLLSFQFAMELNNADEILHSWTREQLALTIYLLGLDNLFLVLYSNTLALASVYLSSGSPKSFEVAALQYLAACYDLLEGVFLLPYLLAVVEKDEHRAWLVWGAGVCAGIKFALIAIGLVYILVLMFIGKRA